MRRAIIVFGFVGAVAMAAPAMAADNAPAPATEGAAAKPAEAAPPTSPGDWYVSLFGGAMFLPAANNVGVHDPLAFTSSTNTGYGIRAAFGAYRAPQVRVEAELSYRRAQLNTISVTNDAGLGAAAGAPSLNGVSGKASGQDTASAAMLNAYYDYDTDSRWHPYIDAGIGAAYVSLIHVAVAGVPIVNTGDLVFAYQFGIGVGYDLSKSVAVAADYRFFTTVNPTLSDTTGAKFLTVFASHNLSLGVRYRF